MTSCPSPYLATPSLSIYLAITRSLSITIYLYNKLKELFWWSISDGWSSKKKKFKYQFWSWTWVLWGLNLEMNCHSPTSKNTKKGKKASNGTQYCKLNMVNYSSCSATSRVCRVEEEGKVEGKKHLRRNFRAPHYTLPLGIFTPFISHIMNCLHFSAFQAPQ